MSKPIDQMLSLSGKRWLLIISFTTLMFLSLVSIAGVNTGSAHPELAPFSSTNNCLIGDNLPISKASGQQQSPAIAYNSKNNEYLVVWQSKESDLAAWNICGKVVSSTGSVPDNPSFYITEPGDKQFPAVTYNNTDNSYLVVWQDARNLSTLGWEIYAQLVSSAGDVNSSHRITDRGWLSRGDQRLPAIAYNGTDNEYLVVWQDTWCNVSHPGFTVDDIYGRVASNTGNPKGDIIPISVAAHCTNQDSQQHPAIAYNDQDKKYLVVWQDSRNGNWDIYGQFISNSGDPIEDDFSIVNNIRGSQQSPDLAYNSQDNLYLVVWQDSSGGDWDIWGREIKSDYEMSHPFLISDAPGSQQAPAVAYSSALNGYLVAWQDYYRDDEDIYGQLISSDDKDRLICDECHIATAENDQESPDVACNSQDNEYMVVWQDEINGEDNDDIYGQRVESTATPTNTPPPPPSTPQRVYLPIVMKKYLVCKDYYVQDPGFEMGPDAPYWIQIPKGGPPHTIINCIEERAHSGRCFAWLGGWDNVDDQLYQGVKVPINLVSGRLTFYYYFYCADRTSTTDRFEVYITDSGANPIINIAELTCSDIADNKEHLPYKDRYDLLPPYEFSRDDLAAIAEVNGDIQLHFRVATNGVDPAAVYIDDVILTLCQ